MTRHHLDRRAAAIVDADANADDDELLTTAELANWLGVSPQWVEIGRTKHYGPPFKKLSSHMVRYRRGDARAWLRSRTFNSTAEYPKRNDTDNEPTTN
jgi:predicted DNA-binding transcriptional regulator AlpA